jgi:hypothetical protein
MQSHIDLITPFYHLSLCFSPRTNHTFMGLKKEYLAPCDLLPTVIHAGKQTCGIVDVMWAWLMQLLSLSGSLTISGIEDWIGWPSALIRIIIRVSVSELKNVEEIIKESMIGVQVESDNGIVKLTSYGACHLVTANVWQWPNWPGKNFFWAISNLAAVSHPKSIANCTLMYKEKKNHVRHKISIPHMYQRLLHASVFDVVVPKYVR